MRFAQSPVSYRQIRDRYVLIHIFARIVSRSVGYGAVLTSQNPPAPMVQLGTSLALAGMMGNRWRRSGKLMPAGMICMLSAAAFTRGLYEFHEYLPLVGRKA